MPSSESPLYSLKSSGESDFPLSSHQNSLVQVTLPHHYHQPSQRTGINNSGQHELRPPPDARGRLWHPPQAHILLLLHHLQTRAHQHTAPQEHPLLATQRQLGRLPKLRLACCQCSLCDKAHQGRGLDPRFPASDPGLALLSHHCCLFLSSHARCLLRCPPSHAGE